MTRMLRLLALLIVLAVLSVILFGGRLGRANDTRPAITPHGTATLEETLSPLGPLSETPATVSGNVGADHTTIAGRVHSIFGGPVAGAEVTASNGGGSRSVRSRPDGTFHFDALDAGVYRLDASHPVFGTGVCEGVTTGSADVELVLNHTPIAPNETAPTRHANNSMERKRDGSLGAGRATVEGYVHLDGQPCRARVELLTRGGRPRSFNGRADARGFYRFGGIPGGPTVVQVTAEMPGGRSRQQTLTVVAMNNQTVRLDVDLAGTASLTGHVVGGAAEAIASDAIRAYALLLPPGATVPVPSSESLDELADMAVGEANIGRDGSFRMANVAPSRYSLLLITEPLDEYGDTTHDTDAFSYAEVSVSLAAGAEESVDIQLP